MELASFAGRRKGRVWWPSVELGPVIAGPTTKIAATCGITGILLTSSMTRVGLMIGGRTSGLSTQSRARANRSRMGMIGTTAIRNGHLTERVSLLSQTGREKNMKRIETVMFG